MEARPKDRRGGKGMVVVKPKTQWTLERRFEVLDQVFDSQGSMVRFERCSEVQPDGVAKKFLLKRVKLKGSNADTWDKDLMTWSQLRRDCRYILEYNDAWETMQEVQNVLCEDARMFLSVCLREMVSAGVQPCTQLYPLWLFHIASALEYMHERNNNDHPILHRALQPDNIMVTDSCVLKLCAFGTSKRLDKERGKTDTVVGGGLFQSPEIRKGQPYDQSADIWSFGVTAVFIADHKRANKTGTFEKLLEIMSVSGQDKATQQAVRAALQRQPSQRPKASEIVGLLRQNYDQDWLRASPPANVFPPPLEEDLIQHALQDHPDARHHHGSSRRFHPSATTRTSSTSSGISTATTASYSPSTTTKTSSTSTPRTPRSGTVPSLQPESPSASSTADSQENFQRELEKLNKTHSSASDPLTPHTHQQWPLTSDDDLQESPRTNPHKHHRSRGPIKERHTKAQEHLKEQTTVSKRHELPFSRTETVLMGREKRAMGPEALQQIADLINNRHPSATRLTSQDDDD